MYVCRKLDNEISLQGQGKENWFYTFYNFKFPTCCKVKLQGQVS